MPPTTSNPAPTASASASAAPEGPASAPIAEAELEGLFAPLAPFRFLILAVSGGADSIAMMHLVLRWSQLHADPSRTIIVATVDHGLRPHSQDEAAWVAGEARGLGLAHEVLTWRGTKPATGVQDAARSARYRLLSELGWRHGGAGPVAIVAAHTEDDQAETFLMRLARGSGLDGLTGMSESRILHPGASCRLVRPLLRISGGRLRATLQARGLAWIEDPSNDCMRFERVRVRKASESLAALGLTNAAIALSGWRLERAREALELAASRLETMAGLDIHQGAFASFAADTFQSAAEELRLRMLARLVSAFGGQDAPARLAKLETFVSRMQVPEFSAATLGGCIVARESERVFVFREPGRAELPELELGPGDVGVWDRRFRVALDSAATARLRVQALGAAQFAQLRRDMAGEGGLPPARAAATLPSFWQDGALVAVPHLRAFVSPSPETARHCSAEFLW